MVFYYFYYYYYDYYYNNNNDNNHDNNNNNNNNNTNKLDLKCSLQCEQRALQTASNFNLFFLNKSTIMQNAYDYYFNELFQKHKAF